MAREIVHRGFRGRVEARARTAAIDARDGTDIDDVAAAGFLEVRDRRLRRGQYRTHVEVVDEVEQCVVDVRDAAGARRARPRC